MTNDNESYQKRWTPKKRAFTVYAAWLVVQGSGLVAETLPCAVDPDVGDLALPSLRQAHVILPHRLVEVGADRNRCHARLESQRHRVTCLLGWLHGFLFSRCNSHSFKVARPTFTVISQANVSFRSSFLHSPHYYVVNLEQLIWFIFACNL